jgi:putative transposase
VLRRRVPSSTPTAAPSSAGGWPPPCGQPGPGRAGGGDLGPPGRRPGRAVHHSDRGVRCLGVRGGQRLADQGAVAPVGSRGDPSDDAWPRRSTAWTRPSWSATRPWRTAGQVGLATLARVGWWHRRRLHGALGHVPPAEHQADHDREHRRSKEVAEPQPSRPPPDPGQLSGTSRSSLATAAGWLDGQLSMRGRALAIQLASGAAPMVAVVVPRIWAGRWRRCSLRLRIKHADPAGHSAA